MTLATEFFMLIPFWGVGEDVPVLTFTGLDSKSYLKDSAHASWDIYHSWTLKLQKLTQ
jgi:hypothetical protein